MKEKKTNKNQPKRDPWALLQSQLGLLSTPVEHEQVSMVSAVDAPRETAMQAENSPAEGRNIGADHENMEMPAAAGIEETIEMTDHVAENADAEKFPEFEADQDAAFDFEDCDIPPNAFGSPKKSSVSPVAAASEEKRDVEEPFAAFALEEAEIAPKIRPEEPTSDPFASDELPTSLWQPRKPASIAGSPAKPSAEVKRATVDSLPRAVASKPFVNDREQEPTQTPVDDLAKHSSGKKRRERGRGRRETPDDQAPRERENIVSFERPRASQEEKKRRSRNDSTEKPFFDEFAFDDDIEAAEPVGFSTAPDFEEPQPPKRRDYKSGKSPRSFDRNGGSFASFENEASGEFGSGQNDRDDEPEFGKNWFENTDAETENGRERLPKRRQDRKPRPEADSPARDHRKGFLPDEESTDSRSRGKSPSRQLATPPRHEDKPTPVSSPTQKIAVPNWDDAIGGIIEKNMQRRPAKNERDRKSNGRGRRR